MSRAATAAEREPASPQADPDNAAIEAVLGRVETMLDPAIGGGFAASEAPLNAAIRAVAAVFGVKPDAGAARGPDESLDEAVPRVARASGLIARAVVLEPGWPRRHALPLIAERPEDGAPLALIPSGSAWRIVDGLSPGRPRRAPAGDMGLRRGWVLSPALPDRRITARDLLAYGLRTKTRDLAAFAAMTFLSGLILSLLPLANFAVTDIVIPGRDFGLLNHVAMMLLGLVLATMVTRLAAGVSQLRLDGRTGLMLRTAAIDRIIRYARIQPPGKVPPPAAATLITHCVETWHRSTWKIGLTVAGGFLVALPSLGLLMRTAPLAGALCLTCMVAAVALASWIARRQVATLFSGPCSPTSWISLSHEALSQVETVRAMGAELRFLRLFAESFLGLKERFLASDRLGSTLHALESGLEALLITIGVAATLLLHKDLPAQDGVVFATALMTVTGVAVSLVHALLQASMLGLQKRMIQALLDGVPAPERTGARPERITGTVEIADAVVRRAPGARPILNGVSLRIAPGEHVGIVGASGSGKTTLLKVLLGLETLESGTVKYDGVDLSLLDAAAIRRQIGIVGQSGRLLPGTLFENVSAGLPLTEDEAWDALRAAALEEDVRALPLGLSTPIGDAEPVLSGGQIQRVLVARAIAHRPRLVVLDEATSALDPAAEAHVAASIDRLAAAVVTVAHRLDTVRACDRIYVLHDGRVAACGTFAELAEADGVLSDFLAAEGRAGRAGNPVRDHLRRLQRDLIEG
jgi:ABC-type bacteriocin/lantibiotic exporter with double-glycine peptidase domain